jgi:hypothetical protein|tara:strand:- start:320 stop:856 length:537 start_codon:yes stop_codon:yes gene_type:complete
MRSLKKNLKGNNFMWLIVKFEKGKLNFFQNELKKKLNTEIDYYYPKLKIKVHSSFKMYFKEINLMNDYIFVYSEKFANLSVVENLKFLKGLKYFLKGSNNSQLEISNFINKCKKTEDKDGYITRSLYDLILNTDYKFTNGPFANTIFKLLKIEKKKIEIIMGNIKTKIDKNKFLISPI